MRRQCGEVCHQERARADLSVPCAEISARVAGRSDPCRLFVAACRACSTNGRGGAFCAPRRDPAPSAARPPSAPGTPERAARAGHRYRHGRRRHGPGRALSVRTAALLIRRADGPSPTEGSPGTRTLPPSGVNMRALDRRLSAIRSMRSGSIRAGSDSGIRDSIRIPRYAAEVVHSLFEEPGIAEKEGEHLFGPPRLVRPAASG
jgi:hypothetical protein